MAEVWNLWVEFKTEIIFRKFLRHVHLNKALFTFLVTHDSTTKIIQFKFELNPHEFAKQFPKSSCNSVLYGKEGESQIFKVI